MKYRRLGKTNFLISEVSLGTWQVGGRWGSGFNHANADEILNEAVDSGINFIDTADVYESGESEKAVGRLVNSRSERIYVGTKCGRQVSPHTSEMYTPEILRKFVEDSLTRLNLERLDLIQLHCPPTEVYYRPEIFELFDRLKQEGKVEHLGVSVEKVEEGLKAIEYDNVATVQIIFNMFRQRPKELFFEQAQRRDVGLIVRVPLASGMLSGKYHKDMIFESGDHRFFNVDGAAFDKGETFSGVDFDKGLNAVERLKVEASGKDFAQIALKWILEFDAVSCVIPGASRVDQLRSNINAVDLSPLDASFKQVVDRVYDQDIKPSVHHLW